MRDQLIRSKTLIYRGNRKHLITQYPKHFTFVVEVTIGLAFLADRDN